MPIIKTCAVLLLLLLSLFMLTACIPGDGSYEGNPANFFSGIWHGWIAPVTLIIGLFRHGIRVYEATNTGWWYDFGFYMAIISGFGGLALTRRSRRRARRHDDD